MIHKDQDLVKHGTNLPSYLLRCEGKTGNTLEKTINFGVLDWNRIEKWKSNTKVKLETGPGRLCSSVNKKHSQSDDRQPSNGSFSSSLSRKFNFTLEKLSQSFIIKTNSTYKHLKSELVTYKFSQDSHSSKAHEMEANNGIPCNVKALLKLTMNTGIPCNTKALLKLTMNTGIPCNTKALLKLTMNNGIPSFKIMEENCSNMLTADLKKLPSGKDDTSLSYTFYSVHNINKKNELWKSQDLLKDSGSGYSIIGNMKISSSYHAEFSGLERDLFVVREAVLYGPDRTKSLELAGIIVKNISKEYNGGLGRSKSTVVIIPGGNHSLPNNGQPSSLIDRWRSGGICDCGGWDVGCELGVLTNQNEMSEVSNPSSLDCLDLCYQGKHKKHAFRLAALENGFYSLEYNASSMSSLQAFSICVAVISSQNLTHIFQVNHLQDANNFIKPIMTRHRKVKSQTIVHPPVSRITSA